MLKAKFDQAKEGSNQGLNMALALLPVDASQVEYLSKRLLTAVPNEVPVIRDALGPHKDILLEKLWAVASASQRMKWACLGHLSQDNNSPKLALETHRKILADRLPLFVATRYEVSGVMEID